MTLRFSARARSHLNAIQEYISERNPGAAARVGERIRESADMLQFFPYAGRVGRSANTREWVVQGYPYILVYEVDASQPPNVTVLGVFHQAQDPGRR
jgi:plasmid stabilization system protein ParE